MNEIDDFKRPDHNDFRTSSELKALNFTGMRDNSISEEVECWVDGRVVFSVTYTAMQLDIEIFNKKYAEYFGLHKVETLPTQGN